MTNLKSSYTKEELTQLYENRVKFLKEKFPGSSEPNVLFNSDGTFNIENWNSGQDIVRYILCDYEIDCNHSIAFECNGDDNDKNVDMIVQYFRCEDEHYITIFFINNGEFIPKEVYSINWYKERGRTAGILKNGKYITEDDYLMFYEKLYHYLHTYYSSIS